MSDTENTPVVVDNTVKPVVTPTIKIKSLLDKTLLVSINVSCFGGVIKDKSESNKLESDHDTKKRGASVVKKILHGKELNAMKTQMQKIRLLHASKTLPWSSGEGIIRIEQYTDLKMALEKEIRDYNDMADVIAEKLSDLQDNDKLPRPDGLGTLYKESDYPSKENFRASFGAEINVRQIATNDFRCGILDEDEVIAINKQIEKRTQEALKEAHKANLSRVYDTVSHLINSLINVLKDNKGRFHQSAITNIEEAIELARGLNIDNNSKVERALQEVEDKVKLIGSADSIRDNQMSKINALDKARESIEAITNAMEDIGL